MLKVFLFEIFIVILKHKINIMKITINLNESEVKGIRDYLKDVDGIERPTKKDITIYVDSIVQSIHSPYESVSNYIKNHEHNSNSR